MLDRLHETQPDLSIVQWPVRVALEVGDSERQSSPSMMEDQDFFLHLTRFANAMRGQQRNRDPGWVIETKHAPVVFDGIDLKLPTISITHRVVQEAKRFMATGIQVDVKLLNLDPRMISCSSEEAIEFASVLGQGESGMVVETDSDYDLNDEGRVVPIEARNQDRTALVRTIMKAIASLQNLRDVDLSGLLNVMVADANHQVIFGELILSVLSHVPPVDVLRIGNQDTTIDLNDAFNQHAVGEWRRQHQGQQLRATCLNLYMHNSRPAGVVRLIEALDDVEKLDIGLT